MCVFFFSRSFPLYYKSEGDFSQYERQQIVPLSAGMKHLRLYRNYVDLPFFSVPTISGWFESIKKTSCVYLYLATESLPKYFSWTWHLFYHVPISFYILLESWEDIVRLCLLQLIRPAFSSFLFPELLALEQREAAKCSFREWFKHQKLLWHSVEMIICGEASLIGEWRRWCFGQYFSCILQPFVLLLLHDCFSDVAGRQ